MSRRGFTLIEAMIVIAIMAIIAAIAKPNLLAHRKAHNESYAIRSLRTLMASQAMFLGDDRDGDGIDDYAASLAELEDHGLIDDELGAGTTQGYEFSLIVSLDGLAWSATAVPITPGLTGDRRFFVDDSGVIRFTASGVPTSSDPPIGG